MEKILIGCPVRNRRWILPQFLESINKVEEYTKNQFPVEIDFYFIINNSTDDTEEILSQYPHTIYDLPEPSESEVRGKYSLSHLAQLRNELLLYASENEYDFLFSVDSDILLEKECLAQLLYMYDEEPTPGLFSPAVRNIPYPPNGNDQYPAHNAMILDQDNITYKHLLSIARNRGIFEVDLLGAATLIPKQFFSCRYGHHNQGEDAIFCQEVKKMGGRLWVSNYSPTIHCMKKDLFVRSGPIDFYPPTMV